VLLHVPFSYRWRSASPMAYLCGVLSSVKELRPGNYFF